MMPSVIYERLSADATLTSLLGGTSNIFELQSLDERPNAVAPISDSHFLVIDMGETIMYPGGLTGPQNMLIWVHCLLTVSRDYGEITKILNQIDRVLLPLENVVGNDGARLTQIRKIVRSRNTIDPGWNTATRNSLYGVLYDESAL